MPLVAHGALQGGLSVGWRDPALLTDEHIAIAGEVADQMAIAVLHADAHERLERSAARLELVHGIDRAVLPTSAPVRVRPGGLEQLRRLAGAERVAVLAVASTGESPASWPWTAGKLASDDRARVRGAARGVGPLGRTRGSQSP